MNRQFSLTICILIFLTVPAFALKLSGSEAEITIAPQAYPYVYENGFDAAGNLIVWEDRRDANFNRVYAVFADDTAYTEYLVDDNAASSYRVRTDAGKVVYDFYDNQNGRYHLRVADLSDIAHPVVEDINTSGGYVNSFDIDDGIVAYYDQGYYGTAGIYICDTNEPKECILVREFPEGHWINSNLAIDDDLIVYSGGYYDDVSGGNRYYVETVDVTDLHNPVITRIFLPRDTNTGAETYFYNLDADGDWLVFYGRYLNIYGVYAIHNYRGDSSTWEYKLLYAGAGEVMSLRIDQPYAVWVQQNFNPPAFAETKDIESQSKQQNNGDLMGAILFDNGRTRTSILKSFTDPDWTLRSAAVSRGDVVWSAEFYHYDDQTQTSVSYSDLFTDSLQPECGDQGYLVGDLDKDCKVDFVDFAMMAENWLKCTRPDDETCVFGNMD